MLCMLTAKSAVFIQKKLILMFLLISGGGIVTVFTNRAFQGYGFTHIS